MVTKHRAICETIAAIAPLAPHSSGGSSSCDTHPLSNPFAFVIDLRGVFVIGCDGIGKRVRVEKGSSQKVQFLENLLDVQSWSPFVTRKVGGFSEFSLK